ncbi:MAG TPA: phosphotransferase [Phycisphaerae bacterium]|nr:phosphotransferase [Phycisphaerae bacterium]
MQPCHRLPHPPQSPHARTLPHLRTPLPSPRRAHPPERRLHRPLPLRRRRQHRPQNLPHPPPQPTSTTPAFVLKQPLPRFKTAAEWLVDIDRVKVERDCAQLLHTLLPHASVPDVLWFDEANYILALSAAPETARLWKSELLSNLTSETAALNAGTLLAIMHGSTHNDPAVRTRYGEPAFFLQQRIDPYLRTIAATHPDLAAPINAVADNLLRDDQRTCLIHGDFSPKNIFLLEDDRLLLLDFEVAFFGNPAFDVATLLNHLLLKAFLHRHLSHAPTDPWKSMLDTFWETYRHTAPPDLVRQSSAAGGHLLAALLLARLDGKSPVEYLLPHPDLQSTIRTIARDVLSQPPRDLPRTLATLMRTLDALPPQS